MNSALKWKIGGILFATLVGIYSLIPTLFSLPSLREKFKDEGKALPWYFQIFPEKAINLGLDLRGGIYVEMEVLIEEGLKSKIDILAQDFIRDLKRKQIEVASWQQGEQRGTLLLTLQNEEEILTAKELIQGEYKNVFQKGEATPQNLKQLQITLDEKYLEEINKDVVSQAVQAVRNRIDRYGLTEPIVQRQGSTRLVVELPGVKDPEHAIQLIKQAGKLEFKLVNETFNTKQLGDLIAEAKEKNSSIQDYSLEGVSKLNEILKEKLPEGTEIAFELTREGQTGRIRQATPYLLGQTAYITGDMLKNAQVQVDSQNSQPYVSLTFNPEGAKNFADLTTANVKKRLAILLDGNVTSAPQIREPIRNGQCRIDLGIGANREATLKEAKDLTLVLQEGALPARLKEVTKNVIGPTLGKDSIQKSIQSILIGSIVVMIFMVVYYSASGMLANFALLLNTLFTLALLSMFQATLTLPGMAGIALTVGMAVDANILIFERIREELNAGQTPRTAVENGYTNAVRAITDSNLTTIISGIILYQFGTGPIKGFAVTLMIGLICNLFTAVFMTRVIFDYFIFQKKIQKIWI